ncbi:MAG: ATP-binding protein [Pseudomonadota bacterium]
MRGLRFVFLLVGIGVATGLFWASYAYFKAQDLEAAAARLTLYRSTLQAELQNFAHLPFLLSLDPVVAETLNGGPTARLDARLARFAQSAGIDAIYLMDSDGLTISASNARTDQSFVGQNYGFRPYFQAALKGELGEFYGIGATTGVPGYFFAMAVRAGGETPRGVIAIKLDLSDLQANWQASGARILLSNADGVVLLASDPSWRYRTLNPLDGAQRARIVAARQFGKEPLSNLDWSPDQRSQTALMGGTRFLYLSTGDLPNSWSLHLLSPDDRAVTRAWLVTGALVLLSGVLFSAVQLRRVRRIGAALKRSESEEAQLRAANARLAVEIEERRLAEQSLTRTQAELERAGRLAALGTLASSVTHELGQPIAAMRNQLAAAEISQGPTPLSDKMQGLVARMENITRQLKFFSRKGRDQFEPVDLRSVMSDALELLAPSFEGREVELKVDLGGPEILVEGNRMRLEQVMTNLVRNALDALDDAPRREIEIAFGQEAEDDKVWFEVSDTGHGLGNRSFEELREPFTTTRESGKGMGLGLTISAGIVADHSGTMTAQNSAMGGASFRVSLPHYKEATA